MDVDGNGGLGMLLSHHAHKNWHLNGFAQPLRTPPPEYPDHRPSAIDCKQFYELACNNLRNFIDTRLFCEASNSYVCLCAYLAAGHLKFLAGERGNFEVDWGVGGTRPLDKAPTFSGDKATHLTRRMRLQVVPFRERSLKTYLIVT